VEGSCYDVLEVTALVFVWREWRKITKAFIKIVGPYAEILYYYYYYKLQGARGSVVG
jgi:hypothetical protein